MKIQTWQINAFTREVFGGNPAGVCLLDAWLPDQTLQALAAEYSLSETAFLVPKNKIYELRWFTPKVEVDLCGHATLASGFVLLECIDQTAPAVCFETKSGPLKVSRQEGRLLAMDFPSRKGAACPAPKELVAALGASPKETYLARDYLAVFDSEQVVQNLEPDFDLLAQLESLGVIVTAPGTKSDFVSRFFAPKVGLPEDPVTGSAHCTLIPYWSERLGRKKLHALQLSQRRGELFCEDRGGRVLIAGYAVKYLEGTIYLP